MQDPSDGVVQSVFGVALIDGWYEAHRGEIEFRGGRLVGLQIGGRSEWRDGGTLTVGFTYFPRLTPGPSVADLTAAERGHVRTRGLNRVYVQGVLAEESELGEVNVSIEHITGNP